MSNYQSPYESSGYEQKPKKGWFGRNWLWFLPTVILLPLLCCCGGPMGLIWFGVGKALEMPPYVDSVALAEQNAEVQNQLGTPIEAPEGVMDLFTMMQDGGQFNLNQTGSQVLFDANVPLTGPNGTATLWIDAESNDGGATWIYNMQEIELPDGTTVDLISGGTQPSP